MSDQSDDALLARRLAALAPVVDSAAARALFERERREPHSRPSRILLPAAAILLLVGGVGIWASTGQRDQPAEPISTISPSVTEAELSTTTEPSPSESTVPDGTIDALPSTTSAPPSTSLSPTTAASVPTGLANWPPRSTDPVPVDAVPRLLPTAPVGNAARLTGIEGTADTLASHDYVQSWYHRNGDGYVTITSNIGQVPGTPGVSAAIDTDGWQTPWDNASVVSLPGERSSVVLVGADGFVQIDATGLSESELIEIARTLERRPSPEAGWDVPALPDDFVVFGESGSLMDASRHLLWTADDGTLIAELLVYSGNANLLTTGWWADDVVVDVIDLDGSDAVVVDLPSLVAIAWPLADGGHALFGFTGDRTDAEAIVRSLAEVDQATWERSTELPDPGRDGCESLFC